MGHDTVENSCEGNPVNSLSYLALSFAKIVQLWDIYVGVGKRWLVAYFTSFAGLQYC